MSKSKIRILLIDDHVVLRMGLVTAANCEPDMEVVGEAECGEEAVEVFRDCRPDVVVLDLRMPKIGGLETMQRIKTEFPSAKIIIFSNYASGDEVLQAFKQGAKGFVVKDMPLENLVNGIREVHSGKQFMPPEVASRMSRRVLSKLTSRELEVLNLVAKGLSNKDIASKLFVVEGTIKVHLTSILAKLQVTDRTQAILAAVKQELIQLD